MSGFIAAVLAMPACAGAIAAPLALVADVVGNASLSGNRLRLLQELDADSVVVVNGGSETVVFYLADGAQWSLKGAGAYRLAASGPEPIAGAPPPERRASPPAFRDLRVRRERVTQGGVVLRSSSDDTQTLRTPVDELVLATPIQFRWTPLAPSAVYTFELLDPSGRRVFTRDVPQTSIALPASIRLRPGTYRWSVRGKDVLSGRTLFREAQFRYADDATRKRLAAARPAADAPFAQRVLYVALLESEGAHIAASELRPALATERGVEWAEP